MDQQAVLDSSRDSPQAGTVYTAYVLVIIFFVALFNSCDRTIVSVLVEDIRADLLLSDRQMGIILGFAFALVHFLAAAPFAHLADRWSRPKIMALGLFGWSLMTMLCGMAQNFFQMMLTRMGVGVGEAAGGPPGQAMITEYVPREKRGRAMSVITLGGLVGLSFGVVYGSWASQNYGWRFALTSVGLAGMALAMVVWFTVIDRRTQLPSDHEFPEFLPTLRLLAGKRAYVLLVLATCAVSVGTFGRTLWEPTFLRRIYDMGAAEAGGWFFIIGPVPSAIGAVVSGVIIDKVARHDFRWYAWMPALGAILLAPLVCVYFLLPADIMFTRSIPLGFVFSFLASLLSATWVPSVMCLAQYMAPPHCLALTAAVWSMLSNFLGYGLGPLIVGDLNVRLEPLYNEDAIRYSLVAVTGMTVLAAVLFYRIAAHVSSEGTYDE